MKCNSYHYIIICLITAGHSFKCFYSPAYWRPSSSLILDSSSNVDIFGGARDQSVGAPPAPPAPTATEGEERPSFADKSKTFLQDQATLLRKEAEELEISMREEARAKGIPEEMINKLIPIRVKSGSSTTTTTTSTTTAASLSPSQTLSPSATLAPPAAADERSTIQTKNDAQPVTKRTPKELMTKIGYLNVGDALSFTTSLNRLKSNGLLQLWDSYDVSTSRFAATVSDLKFKTNIQPANLKLDDIGFNYQNVLVSAVIFGTVCALLSSAIGGEFGFILGYLSVLFPIGVVGIGSFAPALIGEFLLQWQLKFNEEAKQRYIRLNAGKFLVGYILGLPVLNFYSNDITNICEFFQLRPKGGTKNSYNTNNVPKSKRMFTKTNYEQKDIAPSTIVCIAGSVAECMKYESASGSNAVDVNLMYELLTSITPELKPEQLQDHIRWAAIVAHEILQKNQDVYLRLINAFSQRYPLEDCVAIIEGSE